MCCLASIFYVTMDMAWFLFSLFDINVIDAARVLISHVSIYFDFAQKDVKNNKRN